MIDGVVVVEESGEEAMKDDVAGEVSHELGAGDGSCVCSTKRILYLLGTCRFGVRKLAGRADAWLSIDCLTRTST